MKAKLLALAVACLALGGCAFWRHKPEPAVPKNADPLITCPKDDPCSKIKNRRQYFDQRADRYYYFDTATGRYYWENGEPRFPTK